ncbi:MAG: glutaredoxin family protein [Nitrospirota bacterium]|nr:glutaredoxin family protein [Nitrospirota bacterium]
MAMSVKLYTLSTCIHCNALKKFLADHGVQYDYLDVDLLTGAEREAVIKEVRKFNPYCTFPTILIGNQVIVGFREPVVREALGL